MDRFTVEFFDDDDRNPEWCVVEWTPNPSGRGASGKSLAKFYCEADAVEHLYCVRMEHSFEGSGYLNL
ncbi:MAG: hypothetical protein EBU90_23060 [Proteobacteria bacterium]|nr:hypothetical protein [Pseudomonadota bacterium]